MENIETVEKVIETEVGSLKRSATLTKYLN